jgi:hypothetical protein
VTAFCNGEFETFYLGLPGNMQAMDPDPGIDAPVTSAEVVHQLATGGTTTTRRRIPKRTYTLPTSGLTRDDQDPLLRWYLRAYGPGPFMLVDPTIRNQLTMDVALCNQAAGFTVPAGQTLAFGVTASPQPPSKVVDWSGAGNGSVLTLGGSQAVSGNGDADPLTSPPVLPVESVTVSVWLWAAAAVSVALRASGRNGNGTAGIDQTTVCALTAVPQRFSLTRAPGSFVGANFVLPTLKCLQAAAPTIHLSAPQLEYNTALGAWTVGLGVPRVTMTGAGGPAISTRSGHADWKYTFAEVG